MKGSVNIRAAILSIALLALFSPALIPKSPISYLTTDYLTFYSVIQESARFSGTGALRSAGRRNPSRVLRITVA